MNVSASTDCPFGPLQTIAADQGGQLLMKAAIVGQDAGVVDASDKDAFITVDKTRQWGPDKVHSNMGITLIRKGGDHVAATRTKSKVKSGRR